MSRRYELVYVVSPDATDEQVTDLHSQVDAIVQRMGGALEKTDNWGRRRLAYEIGRHKEGTYVLEVINGTGELMKEIDRRLKVTDLVIRHLAVRVDEEQQVVDRSRSKRTEMSRRRRVARGLPPDRQPGEGQRGESEDEHEDRFEGLPEVER
jgi:small subunit ribosomal protein S6